MSRVVKIVSEDDLNTDAAIRGMRRAREEKEKKKREQRVKKGFESRR